MLLYRTKGMKLLSLAGIGGLPVAEGWMAKRGSNPHSSSYWVGGEENHLAGRRTEPRRQVEGHVSPRAGIPWIHMARRSL